VSSHARASPYSSPTTRRNTINFIDRHVVSVLAPTLRKEFHLSNSAYAWIVNAFLITYALSYTAAGWVLDRLDVGRGLTLAISWSSIAGMLTSLARGPLSLGFFRSVLAIGKGAPGLRQGSRHLGTSRSPHPRHRHLQQRFEPRRHDRPPLVAWITTRSHWRAAFIATGALGCLRVAAFPREKRDALRPIRL
jgi:MFS transporter, ACS family, hexuronate transporter